MQVSCDIVFVLIVPLWNWNFVLVESFSFHKRVLIVPLWNWNRAQVRAQTRAHCSNRTFMELKFGCWCRFPQWPWVLIVPLWNWNSQNAPLVATSSGSNRTFMELKYNFHFNHDSIFLSSNRTFMELKSLPRHHHQGWDAKF